jgi:hypothetical protein
MFKNNAGWAIAGGALTTIGLVGGGVFGVANALQVHPSTSVTDIQGITTPKAHADPTRPVVTPAPAPVAEPVAVVAPADPVVIAPAPPAPAPAPAAARSDDSARVGDPGCDDLHDGYRSADDGDSARSSWDGSGSDSDGSGGNWGGGDWSGSDGSR